MTFFIVIKKFSYPIFNSWLSVIGKNGQSMQLILWSSRIDPFGKRNFVFLFRSPNQHCKIWAYVVFCIFFVIFTLKFQSQLEEINQQRDAMDELSEVSQNLSRMTPDSQISSKVAQLKSKHQAAIGNIKVSMKCSFHKVIIAFVSTLIQMLIPYIRWMSVLFLLIHYFSFC